VWVRIYHEEESPQIHEEQYVLTNKNNSNSIKNNINSNKNILTHTVSRTIATRSSHHQQHFSSKKLTEDIQGTQKI
jgi:hypothetical protein